MNTQITISVKDFISAMLVVNSLKTEFLKNLVIEVSRNNRNYKIEYFKTSCDITNVDTNDVIYVAYYEFSLADQFRDCLKKVFF